MLLKLRRVPLLPFMIIIAITVFSLIILYSISGGSFSPWCAKQMWRVLLGIVAMFVALSIRTELWRRYAVPMYIVSVLALIAVAVLGKVAMGAQRWLRLGIFTMQPSEFMRISLIVILAKYFSIQSVDDVRLIKNFIPPTAMMLVPVGFVLLQPDLGTAMLLILTFVSILFVCGVQKRKFAIAFTGVIASIPILWKCLYEYQKQRILMFLNPEMDASGSGYHIIQAKIALGSGGLWGKGLMNGTQSQLDFVPEKQTDFIFVALGEELGFVGCIFLLLLYVMLFIYNYKVAICARNKFNRILVFGLSSMMFFYVFINISMVCGLLPVVGIPLPFFSYGGNALLVLMFSQGIIFAVEGEGGE